MTPSEEQIRLFLGGNFPYLADYFNRKIVRPQPFSNAQSVTVSGGAQFVLIDDSMITGNIAVGPSTATLNGGIFASELAGAVGTAALTSDSSGGSIFNLVDLRDAATNDELTITVSGSERKIWGLVQASNGLGDGSAVGASGSENLQISFVYFDASNALVLTQISPSNVTIEFMVNKIYNVRNLPTISKEGGVIERDVVDLTSKLNTIEAVLAVTTQFPANAVITISTGAGSPSGAATVTGDSTLVLPASAPLFASNARVRVLRGGVDAEKGVEVIWDSATTFHFTAILRVGEKITLIAPKSY